MNLRITLLLLVLSGSAATQAEPCPAVAAALEASIEGTPARVWLQASLSAEIGERAAAIAAFQKNPELAIAALASDERRLDFDALGLAYQGAKAVGPLTDLLSCESEIVRANAARFLGWIGAPAAPAVPAMADLLRDPTWEVRAAAAWSIAQVGVFPEEAVALLAATLGDPRRGVAGAAAGALGKAGAASIPVLLRSLEDSRSDVRLLAAIALARTARPVPEALPMLLKILREDPAEQQIAALDVLRNLDPETMEDAAPTLFPLLADPALGCEVARVLAARGGRRARRAALPVLLDVVGNADELDACAGRASADLAAIGPAAVPGLERMIEQRSLVAGRRAVLTLGALEPPPKTALAVLGRVLSHRELAANAGDALARIGAPAVPILTQALEADEPIARREAARALARIGVPAGAAVPALVRRLQLEPGAETETVIVALGRLGGERARAAIRDLRRALDDPALRRQAAGALARIEGAGAADVIPILVAALREEIRGSCPHPTANEELEAIGSPAVPALVALLNDSGFESKYWVLAILDRQGTGSIEAARPVLLEWLQTGLAPHGLEAAVRLARLPLDDSTRDRVVTLLEQALATTNPWMRLQGAEELLRLGRAESPLVERALRDLQDHRFDEVRVRARSALADIERAR